MSLVAAATAAMPATADASAKVDRPIGRPTGVTTDLLALGRSPIGVDGQFHSTAAASVALRPPSANSYVPPAPTGGRSIINASVQFTSTENTIDGAATDMTAAILEAEAAKILSPFAGAVELTMPSGVLDSTYLLEVEIDKGAIGLTDAATSGLTLVRYDGCSTTASGSLFCPVVQRVDTTVSISDSMLSAVIDEAQARQIVRTRVDERLQAGADPNDFSEVEIEMLSMSAREHIGSTAAADQADSEGQLQAVFALAVDGSGDTGDFTATPIESLSSYEVALSTGSAQSIYDIPVAEAAAGATPNVSFTYSSGAIDGLNAASNNQGGPIGLGWTLDAGGFITRSIEPCGLADRAPTDKCLVGDEPEAGETFSLSLNGVTSELVETGNPGEYRLQNDPIWRVMRRTTADHGYAFSESWEVVTPDGTRWLFGTDSQSARQVPVYYARTAVERPCTDTFALCDTVYQWDLRQVVDTFGNTMDFSYLQETNHYNARGLGENRQYVRDSILTSITYGGSPSGIDANARVRFNWEPRCVVGSACESELDFPDTPLGTWCPTASTACASNLAPTFWSQLALASVESQRHLGGEEGWVNVGLHALDQTFPTPPADNDTEQLNETKLSLLAVRQHPTGVASGYQHDGFAPLLAIDNDRTTSGAVAIVATPADVGIHEGIGGLDTGDAVEFTRTWLGGTDPGQAPTSVSVRYSATSAGSVEVVIDEQVLATVQLPATGANRFATASAAIEAPGGVADVGLRFTGSAPSFGTMTWIRFDGASDLPGLPPVRYGDSAAIDDWEWLPNRVNAPGELLDMKMPRIKTITSELGGRAVFTYGQSHPCQPNQTFPDGFANRRLDCYPAQFGGDGDNAGDFVVWHKWKVTGLTADAGAGQPPIVTTYDYSAPQWAYRPTSKRCNNSSTFNDYRGHNIVTVIDEAGSTQYRFFTGMEGDQSICPAAPPPRQQTYSSSDGRSFPDDRILEGRLYELRRLDPAGEPTERQIALYDTARDDDGSSDERGIFITAGSGKDAARFVDLWRLESTVEVGADKTSAVEYRYDQFGNVITQLYEGDVASDGDERRVERTFAQNSNQWLLSLLCRERLFDALDGGAVVSETRWGYDSDRSQSPATSCDTAPTKGATTSQWSYTDDDMFVQHSAEVDERGLSTSTTDPNGNRTALTRDPLNAWVTTETAPLGWTSSWDYDRFGNQRSSTDVNGFTTDFEYDSYQRLRSVRLPENISDEPSYRFDYDLESRPVQVTSNQLFDLDQAGDDRFLKSVAYIDGLGRNVQTQVRAQATGRRWISARSYDGAGREDRRSSPFELLGEAGSDYFLPDWSTVPVRHEFSRDARGELTRDRTIGTEAGMPNTDWDIDYRYDGWTTQVFDQSAELGARTDYVSDAFGNLLEIAEFESGGGADPYTTIRHSYDAADRRVSTVDHGGNTISLSLDRLGRRTTLDDPSLGRWEFVYDGNGNLIRQRDGRETWIRFDYDAADRVVARMVSDESGAAGEIRATYDYDDATVGLDRLHRSRAITEDGVVETTNVAYDDEGQLLEQLLVVPGDLGGSFTRRFSYGPGGQLLAEQLPAGPNGTVGETITTTYDPRTGMPVGLRSSTNGVIVDSTVYGPDRQRRSRTYGPAGADAVERWDVDQRTERTASYTAGVGGALANVVSLDYSYDSRGNTTSIIDGTNAGQKTCFAYDDFSRLVAGFSGNDGCTSHDDSRGADPFDDEYRYDQLHNMVFKTGLGTMVYGSADPESEGGPFAVVSTQSADNFRYDDNGNQTLRVVDGTTRILVYDVDNRLASINRPDTAGGSSLPATELIATEEFAAAEDGSATATTADKEGKTSSPLRLKTEGLDSKRVIRIIIHDRNERPVADAQTDLFAANADGSRGEFFGGKNTNATGVAEFSDLAPGCYVVVGIAPHGLKFGSGSRFSESAVCLSATHSSLTATIKAVPAGIEGTIVDTDDQPVEGVMVDLFGLGEQSGREFLRNTATNADGSLFFSDLAPQCYVVIAIAPEGSLFAGRSKWSEHRVCVEEGPEVPAELEARVRANNETGEITGEVAAISGPLPDGVFATLFEAKTPHRRGRFLGRADADAKGRFAFSKLESGCYIVVVGAPKGRLFTNGTPWYQVHLCLKRTGEPPVGDPVERYLYDADGKRVARIQGQSAAVYVGSSFEWQTDAADRSAVTHYQLGGRRVALDQDDTLWFAFSDRLNSAVALATAAGEVQIARYDPWGQARGEPIGGSLGFNGQRPSELTGLIDYGARTYDPHLGRFLSPDRLVHEAADAAGINRYSYVFNDPLGWVDPSGNSPLVPRFSGTLATPGIFLTGGGGDDAPDDDGRDVEEPPKPSKKDQARGIDWTTVWDQLSVDEKNAIWDKAEGKTFEGADIKSAEGKLVTQEKNDRTRNKGKRNPGSGNNSFESILPELLLGALAVGAAVGLGFLIASSAPAWAPLALGAGIVVGLAGLASWLSRGDSDIPEVAAPPCRIC